MMSRLEIVWYCLLGLSLAATGLLVYKGFIEGPPLIVVDFHLDPAEGRPGDSLIVESRGDKDRSCPAESKWYVVDSTGLLFTLISPSGFRQPGNEDIFQRVLIIPKSAAPGPAKFWEAVDYACFPKPFTVYAPAGEPLDLMILPPD